MKTKRTYTLKVTVEAETIESGADFLSKITRPLGLGAEWKHHSSLRSVRQNNSMHRFFGLLADELNSTGQDMRLLLREDISIRWSGEGVKEYLWKPVQKILVGKESTTKLTTSEVNEVYENLTDGITVKTNGHVTVPPFPSSI